MIRLSTALIFIYCMFNLILVQGQSAIDRLPEDENGVSFLQNTARNTEIDIADKTKFPELQAIDSKEHLFSLSKAYDPSTQSSTENFQDDVTSSSFVNGIIDSHNRDSTFVGAPTLKNKAIDMINNSPSEFKNAKMVNFIQKSLVPITTIYGTASEMPIPTGTNLFPTATSDSPMITDDPTATINPPTVTYYPSATLGQPSSTTEYPFTTSGISFTTIISTTLTDSVSTLSIRTPTPSVSKPPTTTSPPTYESIGIHSTNEGSKYFILVLFVVTTLTFIL